MSEAETGARPRKGERVAKVIARAGLCSRREAERWIAAGRVTLDGERLATPATLAGPESAILVDGQPLPKREPARLWLYHKPRGLMTTSRDPQGRPTVFERLPKDMPRVVSVGRLDLTSEGLMLLTNDGSLARHLALPATGWLRRYRARVYGTVEPERLAALAKGATIEGVRYGPIRAHLEEHARPGRTANAWLALSLAEGKNREVRRVCEHLGLTVSRLIRVAYGPFQLGGLARGEVREVSRGVLRQQLGEEAWHGLALGHAHHRR